MVRPNLVFDLGMHHGDDAAFYLAKGFDVVALEANPTLCHEAERRFCEPRESGNLAIVHAALWETGGSTTSFFVNAEKDDWSSAYRDWAAKGEHPVEEITVATVTLADLFDAHGCPYYLKCDLEGVDELFARQLLADPRRPAFVSVEAISLDLLALLRAAGYDRFQIVNQSQNWAVKPPNPSREGRFADASFTGHMSGLFGHDLEPGRWLSFAETAARHLDFTRLAERDPQLAIGWLDFHATTEVTLRGG